MEKKILKLILISLVFLVSHGEVAGEDKNYMPGEVLVRFKPISKKNPGRIKVPSGTSIEEFLKILKNDPAILYAEPNYRIKALRIPNDPLLSSQWGLINNGQFGGTAGIDISAAEAWDITTGEDVVVAVIDTGIDYTHEDIRENIFVNLKEKNGKAGVDDDLNGYVDDIYGVNITNQTGNPMDDDFDSHGTHVAGIIGAMAGNDLGITGVAWQVKLMAIKIFDKMGESTLADAIEGIYYAINNGAKILNLSWVMDANAYSYELEKALKAAEKAGAIIVAGAGNYSSDNDSTPRYPASLEVDSIISVAATDRYDNLGGFSNYGVRSVDVAAPGVDIFSTAIGGGYGELSGTSFSAPFVCGIAALIWSIDPVLLPLQVKGKIMNGVDKVAGLKGKLITGGRVDAYKSLTNPLYPAVLEINPSELSPGDGIKIRGIDFGSEGEIILSGRSLGKPNSWTDNYISGTLPLDAYSGEIFVKNRTGISNGSYLQVFIQPPGNLEVNLLSSNKIEFIWKDNSTNETGFKIYRHIGKKEFELIDTIGKDRTAYIDSPNYTNVTYYYTVGAFNLSDESSRFEEVQLYVPSTVSETQPSSSSGDSIQSSSSEEDGGIGCFISLL